MPSILFSTSERVLLSTREYHSAVIELGIGSFGEFLDKSKSLQP
jgi:hypothetical protein